MLLDEPTAHLDDLTEQIIADTVAELAAPPRSWWSRTARRCWPSPTAWSRCRPRPAADAPSPPAAPGAGARVRRRPGRAADRPAPSRRRPPSRTGRRAGRAPACWAGTVLGALASASGVALTATAGWLIVQASRTRRC